MKKRMKMKRYQEGDLVDEDSPESQKVYRSDLSEVSDEERMPRSMPSVVRKAAQTGAARAAAMEARGGDSRQASSPQSSAPSVRGSDDSETSAYTDNSILRRRAIRNEWSPEQKKAYSEGMQRVGELGVAALPVGRVAKRVYDVNKAANAARSVETLTQARERVAGKAAADVMEKIAARKDAAKMGKARRAAEREDEVRDYLKGASYGDRATGHRAGGSIKKQVKRYASGGSVSSSASRRADGIASKGKTKGRFV